MTFGSAPEAANPPADQWTPSEIAQRAVRGAAALGVRQVATTLTGMTGGVVLARLLRPADFGVFAVVAFFVTFMSAFGDGGLGASLVRQREEPTRREYRQVFAAQQMIAGGVTTLCCVVAPFACRAYHLKPSAVWLVDLVAVSGFVISFKAVPAIRLERQLRFSAIGLVHTLEAVLFNGLAILLAVMGYGVMSFGLAMLADAIFGTTVLAFAAHWTPGWSMPDRATFERFRFGVPYQAIGFVSLVKDSITPVVIGLALGARQVGYVEWAVTFSVYASLALMALQPLYLPTFARIADHPSRLREFFEAVIHATNALAAPIAVSILVFADAITRIVFGSQWHPALPIFYTLWFANVFVPTATPCLGLLNAVGLSKRALGFAVLWMVTTWALGLPLILAVGAVGFGIANMLVQLTNVFLFRATRRVVDFAILRVVGPPWLFAIAAGGCGLGLQRLHQPRGPVALLLEAGLSFSVYAVAMFVWQRDQIDRMWRLLLARVEA